jgi:hypothetical protein
VTLTRAPLPSQQRVVVFAYQDDILVASETSVISTQSGTFELPLNIKLDPTAYTLTVWTDYVQGSEAISSAYNISPTGRVSCVAPYKGSDPWREAYYATAAIDLSEFADKYEADVEIDMTLHRPTAQFRVVTDGVQEFLDATADKSVLDKYTVTFSYNFSFPTTFDIRQGQPVGSEENISYTVPLNLNTTDDESLLGFDDVFTGATGSFVSLNVVIKDNTGQLLAEYDDIRVDYTPNKVNVIRGSFLPIVRDLPGLEEPEEPGDEPDQDGDSGVQIDSDYDGDIDINLDEAE